MAYTYETIGILLGEYQTDASVELELFKKVSERYKNDFFSTKLPEVIIDLGVGGKSIYRETMLSEQGDQYKANAYTTITIPASGTLAAMPVSSLSGTAGIGHTFAFYDEKSVLVHELSHFILEMLTEIYKEPLDSELNQAVLAYAWNQSSGSLETLKDLLTSWSPAVKREYAKNAGASFENLFNNNRRFYSDVAGISNASNLQRIGYQTYQNYDTPEREWNDFGGGQGYTVPGNYNYILQHDNEGIVVLGNQYDNVMEGTDNVGVKDYIDGGNGNDTIVGLAGNDTLIGGEGSDELFLVPKL